MSLNPDSQPSFFTKSVLLAVQAQRGEVDLKGKNIMQAITDWEPHSFPGHDPVPDNPKNLAEAVWRHTVIAAFLKAGKTVEEVYDWFGKPESLSQTLFK